jgi:hypothetical protein
VVSKKKSLTDQKEEIMSDEIAGGRLEELDRESGRDDSLGRMIASAFAARMRAYTFLVIAVVTTAAAAGVWMGVLFFQTEEIRRLILYAVVFNLCALVIASMRIFLWQVLLHQRVLRELKRLELRMLELAKNAPTR